MDLRQVDLNARAGFSLVGEDPNSKYAWASEYYDFDWEYAQTPEVRLLPRVVWMPIDRHHLDSYFGVFLLSRGVAIELDRNILEL